MSKKYYFLFYPISFTIFCYVVHNLLFSFLEFQELQKINREYLFLLFGVCSFIVFTIAEILFQKNKDIVGMSFLFVTTVKTIVVGIIGKLYILNQEIKFEKWNFFILFLAFLFFETFMIGRRLNTTKF